MTCKDGSTKIIRINFEAVENNQIHSFVDITELRETERALRESEELHRALIEQSPIGLALCAMDGSLVSVNSGFARIIGHSVDDTLKLSYWEITPEKYSPDEKRQLEQLELHGRYGPYEKEYLHKDGHLVPVRLSGMIVIRDGEHLIWSSVEDITALKKAEAEKVEMAEQLRQSQKMEAIGTLAGGIAHDFNNILSAILGYTELTLLNSDCDAKMRKNLNRVLDATGRAKDLVRQILMFSRKSEVNRQPVQIELVVEEVVNLLRKTIPSTITIDLDVASNMVTILADTTQIHQVVMNLCTNAHHSMLEQGGRIDIRLKLADIDLALAKKYPNLHEGKYVQLTVADSGVGMSPEILSCIFDPFFTTKRAGEGTGMGLAVVHGIIQSHDGVIDVESEPGKGTKVTIFFPLSSDVAEIKTITGNTPTIKGDSEHILWVDDEPMLVELGRETLESFGYRVTATTSALEALRLFRADPNGYDLIVTDQAMPEMAGHNLVKEVMSVRSDTSIIICTGYSVELSAEKAMALGVKKLLMKPLDVDKLVEEVRNVLCEAA